MTRPKDRRSASARRKQQRAAKRRDKATQTRIKGLYYPTGVAPDDFYKALGRLRKQAEAEVERLLVFIDSLDDPGLEPDADLEPTLGSVGSFSPTDQRDWADGDRSDHEEGHGDDEPSLGWGLNGELNYTDDLEDEHDGHEPDVEGEATLGATEATDQEIGWRLPDNFFGAGGYEPEGDDAEMI